MFLKFSVLIVNPGKLLYTVANPARGLLNREKKKKKKSGSVPYTDWLHTSVTFSVEAVGQVYSQMNEFVIRVGNVNHSADLSIEVNRRIRNAWCSFRKYTLELYDQPSAPLELKFGCSETRYSRQCCTAASHGARARASTSRCTDSSPPLLDRLHRLAQEQSRRPPDLLSGYTYYQDGK